MSLLLQYSCPHPCVHANHRDRRRQFNTRQSLTECFNKQPDMTSITGRTNNIRGVSKNCSHYVVVNFSVNYSPRNKMLDIFELPIQSSYLINVLVNFSVNFSPRNKMLDIFELPIQPGGRFLSSIHPSNLEEDFHLQFIHPTCRKIFICTSIVGGLFPSRPFWRYP